ncbi:MAG: hypothetical protein WKG07_03815 [Hymenobacter sp.]
MVAQTLPKSVPLLVLADYLSGQHQREALVTMLRGIHTGRHYYFTYPVPPDALLGRYTLLSELYVDGQLKHSGTATDDFFSGGTTAWPREPAPNGRRAATVANAGPEPVPVRVVEYWPEQQPTTASDVREVPARGTLRIESAADQCFLLYNEEREVLPVAAPPGPVFLRNQQLLAWDKDVAGQATHLRAGRRS